MNNSYTLITSSKFSYLLIFIAFLMSMRCWIGFEGRNIIFFYAFPILMLILYVTGKQRLVFKGRYALFALLMYAVRMGISIKFVGSFQITSLVNQAFLPLSMYLILCVNDEEKDQLLGYIIKWLGIIFIPGLIIYAITFFANVPSLGIIKTHYGGTYYGPDCYNYIFYLKYVKTLNDGMYRFNGPFIEPGDIGVVAGFLLYAAKYNWKKYRYLKIVLLALFASFSLAGYLLTAIGYTANIFTQGKLSGQKIFTGVLVVLLVYTIGINYNGGDNYVNNSILSRLQDTKFDMNTHGRTTQLKMVYFVEMWNSPDILFSGYDKKTIDYLNEDGLGGGIVTTMIEIGLVGIIGLMLPYIYICLSSIDRRYSLLLFLMFFVYLFNRTDVFWIAIMLSITYGVLINENEKRLYS